MKPLSLAVLIGLLVLLGGGLIFLSFVLLSLISKALVTLIIAAHGLSAGLDYRPPVEPG